MADETQEYIHACKYLERALNERAPNVEWKVDSYTGTKYHPDQLFPPPTTYYIKATIHLETGPWYSMQPFSRIMVMEWGEEAIERIVKAFIPDFAMALAKKPPVRKDANE